MDEETKDGLEGLAFELSLRTLSRQEASLDELRRHTGVLLTATAVVSSFLGARALQDHAYKWLTVPGLVAVVISILASVYVLTPKGHLTFSIHGAAMYEYFYLEGSDLNEAHRTLAYWNGEVWKENEQIIYRLFVFFRIACGGLAAAVLLWSLKLPLH